MKPSPSAPPSPHRGDWITLPGGIEGRYVGTSGGIDWVAYDAASFETMCEHFDARPARAYLRAPSLPPEALEAMRAGVAEEGSAAA